MKEWPEGHILFLVCIKHCIHMSLVLYEINKRDLYTVTFKTITKSCTLYKFSLIYLVTMLPWFIFLFHISISDVYVCVCMACEPFYCMMSYTYICFVCFFHLLWWTFSLAYFIFIFVSVYISFIISMSYLLHFMK